jgi:hypothetical protein
MKENVTGWTLHLLKKDIILGVIQLSEWYAFDLYLLLQSNYIEWFANSNFLFTIVTASEA